jgi:hypothetical protein
MHAFSITMAAILLISLIVMALIGVEQRQLEALGNDRPRYLTQITNFTYTSYNDKGRQESVLAANDLVIRPRNYRAFNIKSINEVDLTNARIKEYTYTNKPDIQAGITPDKSILQVIGNEDMWSGDDKNKFGLITRVIINKFEFSRFSNSTQTHHLKAEQASVGKKKHKIVFNQVVLEHMATGKRLISEKLIWDKKQDSFLVPGNYILQTPKREIRGHNVRMNMDLSMQPL